eukprot:3414668-Ditylum_brightwellii.AAC.1
MHCPCNCSRPYKVWGNVRTKDMYKQRMTNHFSDLRTLVANSRAKFDTFVRRFVKHFLTSDTTNQTYHKNIDFNILNIVNPIASVNMF